MQSLFVLLRITIFRKTFISPLANENFVFSKQIPHVTIKMKIHRISKRTTDDKIPHMPQNKINTPAGQTGRAPVSRLTRQRFPYFFPSRQVPVFRLVPPTEDPHSAPPDQHLYSTLPVRKFRHPASPAKGFRILPQPNRFPYSAPAQNFRIAKKTPPSFKNGGVSLIQTSDYSAAEVSSSTLYSAMCSNRLRFSLTFS